MPSISALADSGSARSAMPGCSRHSTPSVVSASAVITADAAGGEDVGQLGRQHRVGGAAFLDDEVTIRRGQQHRQPLVGLQRRELHVAQTLALRQLHQPALAGAFADDQEDQVVARLQVFSRLDHRRPKGHGAIRVVDVGGALCALLDRRTSGPPVQLPRSTAVIAP